MLEKILFVDDDTLMAEFTILVMEEAGYEIEYVESGIDALKKFKPKQYDLILLDIQMPKMDGIETFKKIREKDSKENQTPIVFLTGNNGTNDMQTHKELGALGTIGKPFNPKDLCIEIENLWGSNAPK